MLLMKQTEVEILEMICRLLGKLGIITGGQLLRFFAREDRPMATKVLDYLAELKLTGSMFWDVPASSECKVRAGAGELQRVEVYYLRSKGKELACKTGIKRSHIRSGRPATTHQKRRIYHELLVAECLWWWWRQGKIFDFYNERELKSYRQIPADLQVVTLEDGKYMINNCEVLVQNTRRQIEAKSDHLWWFTPSLRQADIVETIKKAPVFLIELEPTAAQEITEKRILSADETGVLQLVQRRGWALTAPAWAKIMGRDPAQTSSLLSKMAAEKCIYATSVHAHPGRSAGCPARIYAADASEATRLVDRLFAVRVSKAIIEQFDAGYFPVQIDREKAVGKFSNGRRERCVAISENASA